MPNNATLAIYKNGFALTLILLACLFLYILYRDRSSSQKRDLLRMLVSWPAILSYTLFFSGTLLLGVIRIDVKNLHGAVFYGRLLTSLLTFIYGVTATLYDFHEKDEETGDKRVTTLGKLGMVVFVIIAAFALSADFLKRYYEVSEKQRREVAAGQRQKQSSKERAALQEKIESIESLSSQSRKLIMTRVESVFRETEEARAALQEKKDQLLKTKTRLFTLQDLSQKEIKRLQNAHKSNLLLIGGLERGLQKSELLSGQKSEALSGKELHIVSLTRRSAQAIQDLKTKNRSLGNSVNGLTRRVNDWKGRYNSEKQTLTNVTRNNGILKGKIAALDKSFKTERDRAKQLTSSNALLSACRDSSNTLKSELASTKKQFGKLDARYTKLNSALLELRKVCKRRPVAPVAPPASPPTREPTSP